MKRLQTFGQSSSFKQVINKYKRKILKESCKKIVGENKKYSIREYKYIEKIVNKFELKKK